MFGIFSEILVGILALLLIAATVWDIRTRTIPNPLNLAIALLAIPFWYASGLSLWPDIALQIGVAALVFGFFALAFAFGAMGGGDVKMVAALALWLPPGAVLMMLFIMSLAGGALTLFMLLRHRLRKCAEKLEIPYGVAIAFGGMWLISERILNQFG